MKVNTKVPVWGKEALVQVVQLVVVLHQQLQTGLVTTGCSHGLTQDNTHNYTSNIIHIQTAGFLHVLF